MVRTVVYDAPAVQAEYAALAPADGLGLIAPRARRALLSEARTAAAAHPSADGAAAGSQPAQDTIPKKLIKYVPVEVVTVSAGGFAAFNPTGTWLWAALALGAVVNVIYLFTTAATTLGDKLPRPHVYFYLLSALAFVVWGIATIAPVQKAMHLTAAKAAYILVAGTFGIPLLDAFFTVIASSKLWQRPQDATAS